MTKRLLVPLAFLGILLGASTTAAAGGAEPSAAAQSSALAQAQALADGVAGPRWTRTSDAFTGARSSRIVFQRDAADGWRWRRVISVSWSRRGHTGLSIVRARRVARLAKSCRMRRFAQPRRVRTRAGRLTLDVSPCALRLPASR